MVSWGVFQVVLGHISGCPGISGGVWWCVGRGNCTQVTCNNVGEFGVILFGGKCIFQLLPEGLIPDKGIYMQCVGVCELLFHCHAEYGGIWSNKGKVVSESSCHRQGTRCYFFIWHH